MQLTKVNDNSLPFKPLIIIGAGRSGTNALRDALTTFSKISSWPCDEINPIWRHGNLDLKLMNCQLNEPRCMFVISSVVSLEKSGSCKDVLNTF